MCVCERVLGIERRCEVGGRRRKSSTELYQRGEKESSRKGSMVEGDEPGEREREVVLRWRATTASLKYFPNLQNGLSKVHELQNYSVGFLGLNLNHSYFEVNKYLL